MFRILLGLRDLGSELVYVYIDEEGWLHTGDKGYLDSEGYLIIEGRSRDIYKTSSGKYLSPVPIEQALSLESIVEIALVVGEGKKFATCLIFPDLNVLESLNTTDKAIEEFIEMPEFKSVVKGVLAKVNETFNEWEHINKLIFHEESIIFDQSIKVLQNNCCSQI